MEFIVLIITLRTNLSKIPIKNKLSMEKINALGINSYYKNLPFGKKDKFVMDVADAIGKATATVRRKIEKGIWNEKTELPIVEDIIKKAS